MHGIEGWCRHTGGRPPPATNALWPLTPSSHLHLLHAAGNQRRGATHLAIRVHHVYPRHPHRLRHLQAAGHVPVAQVEQRAVKGGVEDAAEPLKLPQVDCRGRVRVRGGGRAGTQGGSGRGRPTAGRSTAPLPACWAGGLVTSASLAPLLRTTRRRPRSRWPASHAAGTRSRLAPEKWVVGRHSKTLAPLSAPRPPPTPTPTHHPLTADARKVRGALPRVQAGKAVGSFYARIDAREVVVLQGLLVGGRGGPGGRSSAVLALAKQQGLCCRRQRGARWQTVGSVGIGTAAGSKGRKQPATSLPAPRHRSPTLSCASSVPSRPSQ